MGQNAQAIEVKKTIIDKQIELSGVQGKFYDFTIPPGVSDVELSGKVEVIGGALTQVYIGVYYAKDCPVTGSSTVQFIRCNAFLYGNYDNENNSFSQFIKLGEKYYIVFQSFAISGEKKIIKPIVTVSYNQ